MFSIKAHKVAKKCPQGPLIYGIANTKFGNCLCAFQEKVIYFLKFYDKGPTSLEALRQQYPESELTEDNVEVEKRIQKLFSDGPHDLEVCLKGTNFEVAVWEALLNVRKGTTASYQDIAKAVGNPKAVRAVGRAVGKNPIAYFVPCHRIIKDGSIHKYASGVHRKVQMLKDEGYN